MTEGWNNDNYVILFDSTEQNHVSEAYGINQLLPHHTILGLSGWDDFIVQNDKGKLFNIPTVPCIPQYAEEIQSLPDENGLEPDDRFSGKIKWYVTPLVFGGDPNSEENLIWLDQKQHQELVVWWNNKYRELSNQ